MGNIDPYVEVPPASRFNSFGSRICAPSSIPTAFLSAASSTSIASVELTASTSLSRFILRAFNPASCTVPRKADTTAGRDAHSASSLEGVEAGRREGLVRLQRKRGHLDLCLLRRTEYRFKSLFHLLQFSVRDHPGRHTRVPAVGVGAGDPHEVERASLLFCCEVNADPVEARLAQGIAAIVARSPVNGALLLAPPARIAVESQSQQRPRVHAR